MGPVAINGSVLRSLVPDDGFTPDPVWRARIVYYVSLAADRAVKPAQHGSQEID